MAQQDEFIYTATMKFLNKNKTTTIEYERIRSIIVLHDYLDDVLPSIIVSCTLPLDLYNEMNTNKATGKILFKLEAKSKTIDGVNSRNIDMEFDYIFDQAKNVTDLDSATPRNPNENTSAKNVAMILVPDILNQINKQQVEMIVSGGTRGEILYSVLQANHSNRNLFIEPFDDNNPIPLLMVPTLNSLRSFVSYVDDSIGLYNSGYIFYIDFDATYLISTKGTKMNVKGYGHPIINVKILTDTESLSSNIHGLVEYNDKKMYVIPIENSFFQPQQNFISSKSYNVVDAIDVNGLVKNTSISINKKEKESKKYNTIRVATQNKIRGKEIKSNIEDTAFMITVSKACINSAIIQPFKQYIVTNTKEYKDYDGTYILINKKEVYANLGTDGFECAVQFTLCKK